MAVILLLTFCAFGACLLNGFVADDYFILLPVPAYWEFDLQRIIFNKGNALEYLPVRDLSLALDAVIWGKQALGFHLTNLLLYLASLPLAYRVARTLASRLQCQHREFIAFWSTLIFALHPLQAEAVNFISARNNILAMLFLLLSLELFLNGYRNSYGRLALSLLAFALALFSKASVIFYPLFLLAMVSCVPALRAPWRVAMLAILPFVLVDAGALWVHLSNASDAGVIHDNLVRFGGDSLLLTVARAMAIPFFYFKQLLFPYPLTILYPNVLLTANVALYATLACLGLALMVFLAWRLGRRSWLPFAALAWLLLSLGPVMNIFPTVPVVADRYAFPAVFGFALICAWLLSCLKSRCMALLLGACLATVWIGLDIKRSLEWRSDLTLYASAYTAYPEPVRSTYAKALFHDGRQEAALALYDGMAIPGYEYHYMRGRWLSEKGRHKQAVAALRQAVREGGSDATVYLALAEAHEAGGDMQQAMHAYLRVREATRQDLFGEYQRRAESALKRLRQGTSGKRSALMEQAKRQPKNLQAQYELAVFLHAAGEYGEASKYYRHAGNIAPALWEPWYNLGIVLLKQKDDKQAVEAFRQALKRQPNAPKTLHYLGIASEGMGDEQAAIGYYQQALAADPTLLQSVLRLGQLFYRKGDHRQSLAYYRRAADLAGDDRAVRAKIQGMMEKLQ
ncbi:MAG: tetratricopeptide repeat protein [Mariprofundaceae bacterium]